MTLVGVRDKLAKIVPEGILICVNHQAWRFCYGGKLEEEYGVSIHLEGDSVIITEKETVVEAYLEAVMELGKRGYEV